MCVRCELLPTLPSIKTPESATGPHYRYPPSVRAWWREDDAAPSIAIACAFILGYVALRLFWWGGPTAEGTAASLYYLPVYLAAAVLSWRASRHPALGPSARRAWALLAGASMCIFVSDACQIYYEVVVGTEQMGVWVDAIALAAYPLWVWGFLAFPSAPRERGERAKFWLDVATVLLGGAMLSWYLLLRPTAIAAQTGPLTLALSLAYPVGDLVLLLAAATILARSPAESSRRAMHLLIAAAVLQFVADLVYGHMRLIGSYRAGDSIDAIWLASGALFALAARVQWVVASRPHDARGNDMNAVPRVRILPYASVAAGVGVLLYASHPVWGQELGQVIFGAIGLTALVVIRQIVAARDNGRLVTARVRQDARFRSLVQNASDLVTVVDANHRVVYQSPSIARLFGHQPSELEGVALAELAHPEDVAAIQAFLHRTVADAGALVPLQWRMWHRDGAWRAVESIGMSLLHDSSVRGVVLNTRDVSERTVLEAQLTHQAFHDPLTGLANRALLRDRAEHALTRSQRLGQPPLALLFLDLDNFKTVNDSLGHGAGDSLLEEAARRLLACVRASDTVARLGGDEFAVFVEDPADDAGCTLVAERIVESFTRPFTISGREVFIGASLGIAIARDGDGADDLLRNADVAMYMAKTRGKGRYERFAPEMHAMALERIELESDLRHAIEHHELVLHYQPIVILETGDITGVEALVRWQHPTRGLLPPAQFIGLAEDTGLIVPLGAWVLRAACQQAELWRQRRGPSEPLAITVNVSGRQLQGAPFIDEVRSVLADTGLEPHALILELTESVLTDQTDTVLATLRALKSLGVRLAIDDFGTGYSSLSYLQRFPIDILKIAKPFVDDVTEGNNGPSGRALAQAVITLGATLAVRTIAEGIEMPQQLVRLQELGCDLGQGFHFSRPVPPAELEALLFRAPSRPSSTVSHNGRARTGSVSSVGGGL